MSLPAPSDPAQPALPAFSLTAADLRGDQAWEAWRDVMARMFCIERAQPAHGLPRGEMAAVLLGDVMVNRSVFSIQRLTRDARRIEATPDHLVLQLYRSGGYAGEIGGEPARIARGQIAICDLRRPLDVQAAASDTIGLTLPRHLLDGVPLDRLPSRLDPAREKLLAARMTMLHLRLPTMAQDDIARETEGLVAALRRLLDGSAAADVLEGRELDDDIVVLAERVIAGALGSPDLSPDVIAGALNMSRATLFRAFAPHGGVMRHVWSMRLQAVRAALEHTIEPRNLSQLGYDLGFKSVAHLSRSFRTRYGAAPRDWRAGKADAPGRYTHAELDRLNACWSALGR